MVHNLTDPQYTADLSEQDVLERQTLIDDGILSEHKVLKYTDTLLSAVNTRSDLANPFNAEVPVSNPCPTMSHQFRTTEQLWTTTTKAWQTAFNDMSADQLVTASQRMVAPNVNSTFFLYSE
jgi:hypothetical protein